MPFTAPDSDIIVSDKTSKGFTPPKSDPVVNLPQLSVQDLKARIHAPGSKYNPTFEEWKRLDSEPTELSNLPGVFGDALVQTAKGLKKSVADAAQEAGRRSVQPEEGSFLGNLAATGKEYAGRSLSYLGGLARPVLNTVATSHAAPNLSAEELERLQYLDYLDKLKTQRFTEALSQDTQAAFSDKKPFVKAADFGAQVIDPSLVLGATEGIARAGLRQLGRGVVENTGKTFVENAIENAAKTGARTAGEKISGATGKVVEKAGAAAQAAGAAPRRAVEKVAEKVVGPDLAGKAAGIIEGTAVFHNPVAKAILGLEGFGAGAKKLGQLIQRLAETPATGPFGRFVNLAKGDAPEWMRRLADSALVKAGKEVAPYVGSVAKGGAHGAAVGAGLGILSGDSPEEITSKAGGFGAFGAGFGVLHGSTAKRAKVFEQRLGSLAELVKDHLDSGIAPESLKNVPDAIMLEAADVNKLGITDASGKPLQIRFADEKTFNDKGGAQYQGADAFHSPGDNTIWLNSDQLGKNGTWATLFHEIMHPLFESEVAKNPELKQQIDTVLKQQGKTIDQAKNIYAYKLIQPELRARKISDPVQVQQRVAQVVAERDAMSNGAFNDPNHWIYSELMAEAGKSAIGSQKNHGFKILDSLDSSTSELRDNITTSLLGALEQMGVTFKKGSKPGTIIPGFENVVSDPSLRRSVYRLLKAQRDYVPGVTKVKEPHVKLTVADMGTAKAPFYPTTDGRAINPYGMQVPGENGQNKFVPWTRRQVRQMAKTERAALGKYIQPGQRVTSLPDEFYRDPDITPWTKEAARQAETAIANGAALEGHYHRLNSKNTSETGDWRSDATRTLGNTEVSWQEFLPMSIFKSKAGNTLIDVASLSAIAQKARAWVDRQGSVSLERWGGNVEPFLNDVKTYIRNREQGLPGDANNIGVDKRDIINAFLFGRNKEFEGANPLRKLLKGADRQGVIRSLRIDRLETLQPHETDFGRPDWKGGKRNFSPEADKESAVETPQFKRWFGKSKVVDEDGKPLVVYRGDRPDKTVFDGGLNTDNYIKGNIFFFDNPALAKFYTRHRHNWQIGPEKLSEKDGFYRAYLSMKKPLVVDAKGEGWTDIPKPEEFQDGGREGIQIDDLAVEARKKGYDGLIVKDVGDQAGYGTQYVVFDPTQIKSATSNRGTFDPKNKNIQFSPEAPQVDADEFRPALRGSRGEIIPGNKGDIHNDVIGRQSMDWRLDNMEPERGFVDNAGNFHSREQVSAALGETVPMQSERLRELQTQAAPDKLAQSVVEQAAAERANFSPRADKFIDSNKSDIKNKRVKKSALPNAVGGGKIPVIHLSSNNNLKKVDPKFFGKGRANRNDLRGGNKAYFFVEGSSLAGDTYIFGNGGYNAYRAEIPGNKIYDLRKGKPDELGYFREINREAADDMLQDAGYDGVLVETGDGRKVVLAFKPVKVEPAGDFKGSVAKVKKSNRRQFSPESEAKVTKREPNEEVRKVAAGYMEQAGLPYKPVAQKVPVNTELAKHIADFYEDARHEPENPAVKASYNAFAKETVDQWNYITSQGVKMEPWKEKGQPYKDSAELLQDIRENKHLWFFPTEGGFGSTEGPAVHPLLENSGIVVNGDALPVNDVFRAVHDYFGHAKDGNEFGPKGELNAFLSHSRMYSDAARPAMAAETLGQNSWVNYGRHLRDETGKIPVKGEKGFVPLQDRPFADQKATVLPDELINKVSQFSPSDSDFKFSLSEAEKGKHAEESGFGNFWLSPDGKFFLVGDHGAWARRQMEAPETAWKKEVSTMFGGERVTPGREGRVAEAKLMEKGWIRISREREGSGRAVFINGSRPSPKQQSALKLWSELNPDVEVVDTKGLFSRIKPESGQQFSPATEAGKELEKQGFEFKVEDYGGGGWQFDLTKDGKSIGYLSAKQIAPDRASLDLVTVTPEYRAQGVSEVLYRELATLLQRQGITLLDGTVVHPAPIKIREKLFGEPVFDKEVGQSAHGAPARRVVHLIDPNAQFSPAAPVESKEFKDWFGKSVGVAEDGSPKLYYHGTNKRFTEFDVNAPSSHGDVRGAIYFHPDEGWASQYGKRVIPAYLKIEKPFDYENPSHQKLLVKALKESGEFKPWMRKEAREGDWEMVENPNVQEMIKANGFDSYFVNDHPGKAVAVYDADQIREAKGGQFSPESEKEKAPVFYSQLEKVVDQKFSGKQMPAAQLAAILRNPNHGVKADELKWSGLDDFLKGKQRVTKEEVQQFLQDNRLEIKEVVKDGVDRLDHYSLVESYDIPNGPRWFIKDKRTGERITEQPDNGFATGDEAEAAANKLSDEFADTKFGDYQLPGGENYREILFQLPGENANRFKVVPNAEETEYAGKPRFDVVDSKNGLIRYTGDEYGADRWIQQAVDSVARNGFISNHWDEPNVLAHARVNDRKDAQGRPGLLVEEIQSDWHQQGRKNGYKSGATQEQVDAAYKRLQDAEKKGNEQEISEARTEYNRLAEDEDRGNVPDAPFKNTWHEFVFRRLVRMAAEEGKDWIGWTTGEQQAERYDLSKQLSTVEATKTLQGAYAVRARNKAGTVVIDEVFAAEKLPDVVGKDLATKIVEEATSVPAEGKAHSKTFSGLDLKVGGEGMKGFYDKILVDYANKFGKKFGARVESRRIPDPDEITSESYSDFMRRVRPTGDIQDARDRYMRERLDLGAKGVEVHALPITPEMKKSVLEQGVNLFSPKAEKTETPEFKRWFGDSKVVDEAGRPLVVYRGDRPGKTFFDGGQNTDAYIKGNVFFFDNPGLAKFYTRHRHVWQVTPEQLGEKDGLYRAYLSMKKPLVVDAKGEAWDAIPAPEGFSGDYRNNAIQIDDLAVEARKKGYDGLIVKDVLDQAGPGTQYVVFRPTQIKSAEGNRGTFNPRSKNIHFSPEAEAVKMPYKREAEPGFYSGWLDPEGNFFRLPLRQTSRGFLTHESMARKALKMADNEPGAASDILYAKGWKRVVPYGSDSIMANSSSPLTPKQSAALKDQAITSGVSKVYSDNGREPRVIWSSEDDGVAPQFSPGAKAEELKPETAWRFAKRIVSATEKGGTTFNVASGKSLSQKDPLYVVSIYPDRSVILGPGQKLTPEQVASFIKANQDLLSDKNNSVGTWKDPESGKVYLDVSWTTPNRALAEYGGWKYNQKAIWDVRKGAEINTGGTGESIENLPPAVERLSLLQREYSLQNPQIGQSQLPGLGRVVLNPRGEEVKNVRDLELARPDRNLSSTERAASDMALKNLRKRVQLLPSTSDKVRVRRAIQQGVQEAVEYLQKQENSDSFMSGKDWYRKDIEKAEETTRLIFPETKDANKMTMFKMLLAAFSGGATPKENFQLASEAFSQYLQTGEIPSTSAFRVSPEGKARALGRRAEMTADKVNKLMDELGGEAELVKYLTTKHETTLLGNKDAYGALDLGPKFGRFFLNLVGHENEVTVDLWATRTWNRWMGTPFRHVTEKGTGKKVVEMVDVPSNEERNLIIEAFQGIAKEVSADYGKPLDAMDAQAVLWFYEKDLFSARGVRVDRGSFSEAAKTYQRNPVHTRRTPVVTGQKPVPKRLQIDPKQANLFQ